MRKITLKENERSNSDKECNMNGDHADTVERRVKAVLAVI